MRGMLSRLISKLSLALRPAKPLEPVPSLPPLSQDSHGSEKPTTLPNVATGTNLNIAKVRKMIAFEEGRSNTEYRDSEGYLTIGIGHLTDSRRGGSLPLWAQAEFRSTGRLTDFSVDRLFADDIAFYDRGLRRRAPWVNNLDEVRYACLLDMAFQLGVTGLLGFVNTLAMVEKGNYNAAADGMRHSKWYNQTPNRAKRRMAQMRTGQWGQIG